MPGTLTYGEILEHADRLEGALLAHRRQIRESASPVVRGRLMCECAALQDRIEEIRSRCQGHGHQELYTADVTPSVRARPAPAGS